MIGKQIGRYRVDAKVGQGGMGMVYRGTQVTLDRTVAIKMLLSHLADADNLERFRREALTLARVDHPNIVHVYDIEEVDGAHFIIMEFVGGPTLAKVMEDEGLMSPARATDIVSQLAAGLGAAHKAGVVHRDIKPDNVLFNERGVPKVTDFGIAHMKDAGSKTRTGVMLGTPYYMSPEQARGQPVTGAADIYASGILLYEMLCGEVPFTAADPISLALKHVQEAPQPLKERRSDLPDALCNVVHQALEKDPANRFRTAELFHDALVSGSWSTGRTTLGGTPIAATTSAAAQTKTAAGPGLLARIRNTGKGAVPREPFDSLSKSLKTGAGTGVSQLRSMLGTPSIAGLPRAFWFGVIAIVFSGGFMALQSITSPPVRTAGGSVLPAGGGATGGGGVTGSGNSGIQPPRAETGPLTEAEIDILDGLTGLDGPNSADTMPDRPQPEPAPVDPQSTPVDPQPIPVDPQPTPVDPDPTPTPTPPVDATATARQSIILIVDRQRRATENQDAALYVRDVHPDLRGEAMAEFEAAMAVATDFSSTITNVDMAFDGTDYALVTFQLRLTARERDGGDPILIFDGPSGWEMALENGRWWIVAW